ncbi:CoA transferase [Sphaerisporangium sp. NPDC088356]|uniref:CaiB/BaiF CoA transferase family protein n=1 Tax=Sphaerisporangium sp. NPDC088356 TaxID=3154871 RepID=UPI00341CAF25
MSTAARPLAGIRIVDLALLLPGPWATLMLSELGADVVHVEPPGGDPLKAMMPGAYASVNRGKRVVELDLKSEPGRQALYALVDTADVFVEGFRPGTADRLGCGPADMRRRNPRLVYCSLNGYGSSGPYAHHPGHDINYLAVAGVLFLSGDPGGPPQPGGGVPVADLTASLFTTQAILAALMLRERGGVGSTIEVPIAAAALKLLEPRIAEYDQGDAPSKARLTSRGGYGAFECRDGRWIAVGCMEEHFWRRLCTSVDRPDLLDDPRFPDYAARRRLAAEVNAALAETFTRRTRAEWVRLLVAADVPATPVNQLHEIEDDPQIRHWDMVERLGAVRTVRLPYTGLGADAAHLPERHAMGTTPSTTAPERS